MCAGELPAWVQFRRMDPRTLDKLGKGDRAIGAGDPHGTLVDLKIAWAGFQRFGGDLSQVLAEFAGRALDADAACWNRSRATGAETGGDQIGVALEDVDALGCKPELLGDELRVSRLMALPGRLGPDQDGDIAVGVEPDVGGLLAHGAADL